MSARTYLANEKAAAASAASTNANSTKVISYTSKDERRLVRKSAYFIFNLCVLLLTQKRRYAVDLHILPGLTFLYLLSFLDRSNGKRYCMRTSFFSYVSYLRKSATRSWMGCWPTSASRTARCTIRHSRCISCVSLVLHGSVTDNLCS
jgi:hypothetical protein